MIAICHGGLVVPFVDQFESCTSWFLFSPSCSFLTTLLVNFYDITSLATPFAMPTATLTKFTGETL